MDAKIIPLAITMMAGPQIISSIIFVTSDKGPIRVSLSYVVGVALAATFGIGVMFVLAHALDSLRDIGGESGQTGFGKAVDIVLVAGLIAFAVRSYLGRATSEPPNWLGTLQAVGPLRAFELGLMLILLMPGDLVVMATVGVHLRGTGHSFLDALPMIAATSLIAALPLLAYLLLGARARRTMPALRDWMNTHSWLINIAVAVVFIVLILTG